MAEQLWDLPLSSKSGFDLDSVAKAVNGALKEVTTESFVSVSNPQKSILETKLEIVKYVIAAKLAENKAALDRAANIEKRQKLLAALAEKEQQSILGMSKEEIEKELAAIDK